MRDNHMDLFLVGILLILPALGIALFADQVWSLLRYDRDAMLDGQWWRLLTGHWIHLSNMHLILNLGTLTLVLALLGRLLTPLSLLLSALLGALTVSVGLLTMSPDLYWYAGLSGVIATIWGMAASRGARCGSPLGWTALVLLLMRVLWEQLAGANPGLAQLIGGAVIVDAHLYGAGAGILIGLALPRLIPESKTKPSNQL